MLRLASISLRLDMSPLKHNYRPAYEFVYLSVISQSPNLTTYISSVWACLTHSRSCGVIGSYLTSGSEFGHYGRIIEKKRILRVWTLPVSLGLSILFIKTYEQMYILLHSVKGTGRVVFMSKIGHHKGKIGLLIANIYSKSWKIAMPNCNIDYFLTGYHLPVHNQKQIQVTPPVQEKKFVTAT